MYLSEAWVFVPTVNETKKKFFDSNFDRARADVSNFDVLKKSVDKLRKRF
jgi:hypothetical protein